MNPVCRGITGVAGLIVSIGGAVATDKDIECYRLEKEPGLVTLTRLAPASGYDLYLDIRNIGLDTTSQYKLRTRIRQVGGEGMIEAAGMGTFKIPAGDQWQELTFDISIPETADKPNIRKSTSIKITPPNTVGGQVSVASVSLTPVLPDKILPQEKKVLIETRKGPKPLEAIFVRRNATPGEILAAHELRLGLYWYCGYSIPVFCVDNEKAADMPCVYIGRAALDHGILKADEVNDLGFGGYVLRCKNGCAGVAGEYDSGTICGAAALVSDLGIHYLKRNDVRFPYRDEVFVPDTDTLVIRERSVRQVPAFAYQIQHGGGGRKQRGLPWGFTWERSFMGDTAQLGPGNSGWAHNANYMVPYDKYGKTNPEYFALNKKGQRLKIVPGKRFDVHLCMSNPDVQRIASENLLAWMEKQSDRKYFIASPGDGLGYCECKNCRAWDPDPEAVSKTDRYLRFINILAKAAAQKHPGKRVCMIAYTDRCEDPPKREKPESNVDVLYCLWSTDWRCKQHPYCVQSKEGVDNLESWLKLMPGRVHIFDYPWYTMAEAQRLRYFHKKGVVGVAHCSFRGQFPELTKWVLSRMGWNIDLDVRAEIARFMDMFYGPASPEMQQYFYLIQDAKDLYAHAGEPIVTGGNHGHSVIRYSYPMRPTGPFLLTAAEMDRAYDLCVAAEKAVATNAVLLNRIRTEKKDLLVVDLTQRNPVRGLGNLDEAAFARRLAEFLAIAKADWPNHVFYRYPMDKWLRDVARLDVKLANWRTDTNVLAIIASPEKALQFNQTGQLEIAGGWRLPAKYAFAGEFSTYKGHDAVFLRRPSSGLDKARFILNLKEPPEADLTLTIEGMDDEKPDRALLQVQVNGQTLFNGTNAFKENAWSQVTMPVPATLLKAGKNEIALMNMTPDSGPGELTDEVAIQAAGRRKQGYFWGWMGIARIDLVTP